MPVLYYLAGLTCTEETFVTKAGALEHAARHGIMLVAPDTSPRVALPGDRESWDFGIAAGFYLDATQEPWSKHYHMYSYVVDELPGVIAANFKADIARSGIMGHSMGGHGALTIALKNPEKYQSVSAFAPIAAPIQSAVGQKAFTGYLGRVSRGVGRSTTRPSCVQGRAQVCRRHARRPGHGGQIPRRPAQARVVGRRRAGTPGRRSTCIMREGYDHGYFFIQTFIAQHMDWHAQRLLTSDRSQVGRAARAVSSKLAACAPPDPAADTCAASAAGRAARKRPCRSPWR